MADRRWRRARLGAAGVAVALLLGSVLSFVLPWALVRMGVGSGWDAGLLRWGRGEYVRRVHLSDRIGTRSVGWAFVRGGERVELGWDVEVRSGDVTLAVDEALGGGVTPLWRERFTAPAAGEVAVPVPAPGLYQVRISRTGWAGRARVRWSVAGEVGG